MTVLITALGAGAALLKPATDQAVVDAYTALKNLLVRKFGSRDPALESVLTHHAADPGAWRRPAEQVLASVGADRDQEVVDQATHLLKRAEDNHPGISGGVVGQINAHGGRVFVTHADRGGYAAGRDIIIGHDPQREFRRAPAWVKALTVLGVLVALGGFGLAAFTMLTLFSSPRGFQQPPPNLAYGFGLFFAGLIFLIIVNLLGNLARRTDD